MRNLDLADIQGNILRGYGREGFPTARYMFLNIADAAAGRAFVERLRPRVTTAARWKSAAHRYPGEVIIERPKVALNLAFSFFGLVALGLPTRTLAEMPPEFIDGMAARSDLLGDRGPYPKDAKRRWRWDPIWERSFADRQVQNGDRVHVFLSLNAQMNPDGTPVPELETVTQEIVRLCAELDNKVRILGGHGLDGASLYQDAVAVMAPNPDGTVRPTPKEHFGFTDGIGDPVFEGQYTAETEKLRAVGSGALLPDQTWRPLATGEFFLGYPDEAQEIAGAAMPFSFSRNGTFTTYRKLHQNVGSFLDYIDRTAKTYGAMMEVGPDEARETLMAKIAGRWSDGIPLMKAPTYAAWQQLRASAPPPDTMEYKRWQKDVLGPALVDFKYADDPQGIKCPLTAHLRRVNPRDMLDPTFNPNDPKTWNGSVLNNRRRILRRGLPYGSVGPEPRDDGEHGVIFMAICASLFRQFEFIQQQWIQYGLDFNAGNDTCPLIGNHLDDEKMVIPADPKGDKPPFICDRVPQFVETRGGEYFFIPSMTALRMIGMGVVDPT